MRFTDEQQAVIDAPVGNRLVSAAAGSGKTTVLTERIIRRVLNDGTDVRELLVMTFTEAAAAHMKRKIGSRLREEQHHVRDAAARAWIARQVASLPRASISTIHSFCLDVLRSFQYLLQDEAGESLIEPGSRVLDPATADLLFADALDRVLGAFYRFCDRVEEGKWVAEGDGDWVTAGDPVTFGDPAPPLMVAPGLPPRGARPAPYVLGTEAVTAGEWVATFQAMCDGYSPGRDDRPLRELIVQLHRFLRSMPDYADWVAGALDQLAAAVADFAASKWAGTLVTQAELLLQRAAEALPELFAALDGGLEFVKNPAQNGQYIAAFRHLLEAVERAGDAAAHARRHGRPLRWDDWVEIARTIPEDKLSYRARDVETAHFVERFNSRIPEFVHMLTGAFHTKKFKDHFEYDTQPLFTRSADSIAADLARALPPLRRLAETVLLADQVYAALKRQERGIDFSDFEHLALHILRVEEARTYYRGRYGEIYLDEYQDTSSIQEEIVACVAQDNLFMVGDVKQSIYRFRHANPTLFLERSRRYGRGSGGALSGIGMNFRSTAEILAAVNRLFTHVMTREAGEIEYTDGHALTPATSEVDACPVYLWLVDTNPQAGTDLQTGANMEEPEEAPAADDDDEAPGAAEPERDLLEGMVIARRIRAMREQGVAAEEIAVLGRTHWVCRQVAAALDEAGIAHTLPDNPGFLATPELMLLDALVALTDNAAQDIPLAAVMRSRLHADVARPHVGRPHGFAEDELLAIRVASAQAGGDDGPPRLYFHQAVAWYAEAGPDAALREAVRGFLTWLAGIRDREPYLRLHEWFADIFERSAYLDYVSQLPDGGRRANEISLFLQWAEAFEVGGARGLHRFAGHLAALRAADTADSPFTADQPGEGRVRILTIHGSKGLEFDHVFVAGCGRRLPISRGSKLLYSEREGLAPLVVEPARWLSRHTYVRLAMERSLRNAEMAEEMRLLYVAMTRAARSLTLVAGVNIDPEKGVPALARRIREARRVPGDGPLPAHLPLAARSYLDWLVLSMANDPHLDWTPLCGTSDPEALAVAPVVTPVDARMPGRIRLEFPPRQLQPPDADIAVDAREREGADGRSGLLVNLTEPEAPDRLDTEAFRTAHDHFSRLLLDPYRFPGAAVAAAKLSVSELKRREHRYDGVLDEEGEAPATHAAWLRGSGLEIEPIGASTPPSGDQPLSGAERGSALHAVLRYLDLAAVANEADADAIRAQIDRMREHAMLTAAEAGTARPLAELFLRYAGSPLGRRIQKAEAAGRLYREMPFTLRLDAAAVHGGAAADFAPDDAALVQGIIDLWFVDPETSDVVLVDFKSDRLRGADAAILRVLTERYRAQLDYYAQAIAQATGRTVTQRYIWLFDAGKAYKIE